MFSHCFVLIGCSIECKECSERAFNFSSAESNEKAQFASTLISMSLFVNSCLMFFNNLSSVSKSRAPIFIFTQSNPALIFLTICLYIKLLSPIQIKPLIGMFFFLIGKW